MEQSKRLSGTLSLCRRAGRLALGYDPVKESVQKENAQLILFAADVSPKTEENIRFAAGSSGLECLKLTYTMDELWFVVGKRVGVVAVNDHGFAAKIRELAGRREDGAGND